MSAGDRGAADRAQPPRLTAIQLPGETAPVYLVMPAEGRPEIRIGTRRPRKPASATIVQQGGVTEERYHWRGKGWDVALTVYTTAASRWIEELTVAPA